MKKVESLNFKYIPLFLVLWMMIKYLFLHQRGKMRKCLLRLLKLGKKFLSQNFLRTLKIKELLSLNFEYIPLFKVFADDDYK